MSTRTVPPLSTAPGLAEPILSRRTRVRRWIVRFGLGGLALGLIGLNAWWWWWDRPPEEMATIESWIRLQRDDDAERALRSLLRRSPADGEARMTLARLLGKRGDYLGCAEQLHQVPDWWPTKADALFLEAQAYKLVDRAREAEAAWRACLADDPLHPVPLRHVYGASRELVGLHILQMRLEEARETLMTTHDLAEPAGRPGILVLRMQAEVNRIRPEEAVKSLQGYVRADPDNWQARRALARELQLLGDETSSDRNILACLDARPDDPSVWRTWLEILYQRGDRDRFQEAVLRLPPSADSDAELWKARGLALTWSLDLDSAADAFASAILLNEYEPEYHYRLGLTQNRLGQTHEATRHLERHQELKDAQGQLRDAISEYLEASDRTDPSHADYREAVERLAFLCEQLGWTREAEAWRATLPPIPWDERPDEPAPGTAALDRRLLDSGECS